MRLTDLIIDALTTYRITRLVTEDTITDPLREKIFDSRFLPDPSSSHFPDHPLIPNPAYILTCPHCASVYAAALTLILPNPAKKILALAAVTTLIHQYTDKLGAPDADNSGWDIHNTSPGY